MFSSWMAPEENDATRPTTQKMIVKMTELMGRMIRPVSLTTKLELTLLLVSGSSS